MSFFPPPADRVSGDGDIFVALWVAIPVSVVVYVSAVLAAWWWWIA